MKASDNPFSSLLVVEGAAPASPATGDQRLFIDSADHKLKRVNSSGTVTTVEGSSGGGGSSPLVSLSYEPATAAVISTTSSTWAAIDSTNLVTPSFTPSTSAVWVTMSCMADQAWTTGAEVHYEWGVLASGTLVTGSGQTIFRATSRAIDGQFVVYRKKVAVTSGVAVTWQAGHRLGPTSTVFTQAGRVLMGGTSPAWGAFSIEVEAA